MKNYASDVDVASNNKNSFTRNSTQQENYKSESSRKKKVELEDSVEPIYSEIFRFTISPEQAKLLTNYLQQGGGENIFTNSNY